MDISFGGGQYNAIQKIGSLWVRYLRVLFFVILLGLFCFSVFLWYGTIYDPENRVAALKQEIKQSENGQFKMSEFERIQTIVKSRNTAPIPPTTNDPFYR